MRFCEEESAVRRVVRGAEREGPKSDSIVDYDCTLVDGVLVRCFGGVED